MNYDSLSITSNFPWTVIRYIFCQTCWICTHTKIFLFISLGNLWARAMFQTNLQLILNHVMMLIHACMLFSCYLLFFIWHDNHDSVKFLLFRVMIMEDKKFKSQTRYYSSMNPSYFIIQKIHQMIQWLSDTWYAYNNIFVLLQ